MHQRLTDRKLQALKPAAPGKRYDVMDTDVRGFGVRVTDKGQRTFMLLTRYPGSTNPTRRAIGDYPTLTLEKARQKARAWRQLIEDNIDPKTEEERRARRARRAEANSFEAVVEAYAKRVLPKQRRGHHVARELRNFFVERWKGRPITSIERCDVIEIINETIDRGTPYQAHNLLGHVRSLFNWAIATEAYGLEHSPCDRIRPRSFIGERVPRQRVLDDAELRVFWHATEQMGYPFGPLFQLLLLTGCRKTEIAGARWCEIDKGVLTIPAERFKSNAQHLVPLSSKALTIIESLPRLGDYLFGGNKPVGSFDKPKDRLDKLMADAVGHAVAPFRTHDLRRTVRTRLSSLKVPTTVAEMVLGHGKRGLERVYDQHLYLDEIRDALEKWAGLLRDIVEPPPANVFKLGRG